MSNPGDDLPSLRFADAILEEAAALCDDMIKQLDAAGRHQEANGAQDCAIQIRMALKEQPEQEPVAWRYKPGVDSTVWSYSTKPFTGPVAKGEIIEPLYGHPWAQPFVPSSVAATGETPRVDALINDDTDWMTRDQSCVGELLTLALQLERERNNIALDFNDLMDAKERIREERDSLRSAIQEKPELKCCCAGFITATGYCPVHMP